MTTALVILATLIFIAGLFAALVERTTQRDVALAELARRDREDAAEPRLRLVDGVSDDDWFLRLYDEHGNHR